MFGVRPQPQNSSSASTRDGDITMYTTSWCSDCRRAKRIFAAQNVPFTEVDIDMVAAAAEHVMQLNGGHRSVPTIVFPDGTKLVEPSNATLEAKLAAYTNAAR